MPAFESKPQHDDAHGNGTAAYYLDGIAHRKREAEARAHGDYNTFEEAFA